jgi:hypothetical protein
VAVAAPPAALAAKQATQTIPIVFSVADAVTSGLVTNLARPGGNVTGLTSLNPELNRQVSGTTQAGRSGGQSGHCPLAARWPRRTHGQGHAEGSRSRGTSAGDAASIR